MLENQHADHSQQHADYDKVELSSGVAGNRFFRSNFVGALQSFWRQLVRPGQHERDRKPQRKDDDN